jgi:hypothetical protein
MHFLQERWQIFGFIKDHRKLFPIEKMCTVFKASRSRFYTWLSKGLSNTFIENQTLTVKKSGIFMVKVNKRMEVPGSLRS